MARRKGNVLRKYEGANLLFFLAFAVVLAGFVAWVFQSYRSPRIETFDESAEGNGVVSELISPDDSCIFYLSTKISESGRRYRGKAEIPPTDDGLIRDLFGIEGVTGMVVDQKMVILQKSPAARWEAIQPMAKEVINNHLHMHQ
jgi:Scaffold protein Nfu/NifU N terminal